MSDGVGAVALKRLEDAIAGGDAIHAVIRGWVNYFHYRNSNQVMEKVKTHAEQRMRKHLMKRRKVKDRGIGEGRFPSVALYRRYGLYKVPTAAGWRSAHA